MTEIITICHPKSVEAFRAYISDYMKVRVLNSGVVQVARAEETSWRDL